MTLVSAVGNEAPVFDLRPIEIGGYKLLGRTAKAIGRPSLEGWTSAMQVAAGAYESSPYWICDLLAYAESRVEWAEKLDQAMAVTGLQRSTLHKLGLVGRHVGEDARQIAPSIGHTHEIAQLEPTEQIKVLTEAREKNLTVYETRKVVQKLKRTRRIEGQAVLEGQFRVIYADPPWKYADSNIPADGSLGKASRHYSTMTIKELCVLPVAAHATPDAVLFLWVTSPMLPEAFPVIDAWGFTYKTSMVWDKVLGNWGHYVRVHHELLLICTRGSCLPDEPTPMPDSVQTIRRSDEHSEKPEDFRRIITELYTAGPYLELFGRRKVDGWTVFGNDARLWHEDVQTP